MIGNLHQFCLFIKKYEKGSVENCRPVSLTSLIMKVSEKCFKKEILANCENEIDFTLLAIYL